MPCHDPRSNAEIIYENGIDPALLREEQRRSEMFEAALCAICNELQKLDKAEEILLTASRNSKMDLMSLWYSHQNSDRARIARMLENYSTHEIDIMRDLLGNSS